MRHVWVCVLLAGCMVGPDYHRPDAPVPVAYQGAAGLEDQRAADAADQGAWWSIYHDPELDRLERMVEVSNQTVKQFEAQYRNAVALVQEARASLFPTVGLTPTVTRSGSGGGSGGGRTFVSPSGSSAAAAGATARNTVSGTVTWDLDVWGRVRRQVESSAAAAQVSAADLANAKLSAQVTLATDYFDLRAEDSLADLLRETVAAYQRALKISENQYRAGTTSRSTYVTAQAQLQSTEAQLVGGRRAAAAV